MDSLDNDLVKKPKVEETHKLGFSFGTIARVVGFFLMLLGLVLLLTLSPGGLLLGIFLFPAGGFMLTSAYGTQVDYSNEFIREYGSVFGIRRGKWKHLDKYPFVTVLTANRTQRVSDITGLSTQITTNNAYGIYFLSKTHRNRILLKRVKGSFKDAVEEAKIFAKKSEKDLVKFAPKRISRRRD